MTRIILFFIVSISFGQNIKNYQTLIEKSDNLIFNFQFDDATELLATAIHINSQRPEAFQLLSKIYLWFYLGSENPLDKKLFEDYSDSVITKCNNILDENDSDAKITYVMANAYRYKAMMSASTSNSLDAFWATKTSVGYYEDVLDIDSTFYSAYGGIGIFEYALSFVPSFFSWALTFTGLSANENIGFEKLIRAYKYGKEDKYELEFHLSKMYDEYLSEYKKSVKLLDPLILKFPNNTLFLYQRAIEYIKLKNLVKAETDLKEIQKRSHPEFVQTLSFTNFLLGDIYFRRNNYEQALEYYHEFLTSTQTIDYTGIASLRAAICYHFLDNDLDFRKYSLLASNGNQDIEEDSFAKEFSLKLLQDGFTKDRELQIKIGNIYLAGKNNAVIDSVNANIDSVKTEEVRALLLDYKSSALIELGLYNEAKTIANELRKYELQSSFWIKPMAFVNLAKISIAEKNKAAAEQYVKAAADFNNYSRKHLIESYINKINYELNDN